MNVSIGARGRRTARASRRGCPCGSRRARRGSRWLAAIVVLGLPRLDRGPDSVFPGGARKVAFMLPAEVDPRARLRSEFVLGLRERAAHDALADHAHARASRSPLRAQFDAFLKAAGDIARLRTQIEIPRAEGPSSANAERRCPPATIADFRRTAVLLAEEWIDEIVSRARARAARHVASTDATCCARCCKIRAVVVVLRARGKRRTENASLDIAAFMRRGLRRGCCKDRFIARVRARVLELLEAVDETPRRPALDAELAPRHDPRPSSPPSSTAQDVNPP